MVIWGFNKFNADAQKCYDEIAQLGNATPQAIVDYARDENTELHKCFQWDDTKAAESWRRQQARLVVCSLTVTVETKEHGAQTYRIIEHDSISKTYKPVIFTVRNKDEYGALLSAAKADLAAFRQKYKNLVELQNVIDEIEKLI